MIKCCDYRNLVDRSEADDIFNIAIYDPPFDTWKDINYVVKAKTYICFSNFQNRRHVENLFGKPRFEIIWHFKDGRWVSHKLPRLTHESILIYGDINKECYVGDIITDKKPQKKGRGCIGRDKNLGDRVYTPRDRKMLNSVIEIPRNVGKHMGVWGKPKKLVSLLFDWLVCEGDHVWDGFAGSGVFCEVSSEFNCIYSGCDNNEETVKITNKRLCSNIFHSIKRGKRVEKNNG